MLLDEGGVASEMGSYGPGDPGALGADFASLSAGGSLGFADPDAGIGLGYVMNQMSAGLGADPRWKPMIDAVYASL